MKERSLKRLCVFTILMFSVSFLNAQCSGNKIQLFKSTRNGACLSKCVPSNQVQKYISQGWRYACIYPYPFAKNSAKAVNTKSSVMIHGKIQ